MHEILLWLPSRLDKAKKQKKQQCQSCSPFLLRAFMCLELDTVSTEAAWGRRGSCRAGVRAAVGLQESVPNVTAYAVQIQAYDP